MKKGEQREIKKSHSHKIKKDGIEFQQQQRKNGYLYRLFLYTKNSIAVYKNP